jgi:D-alanine-D-alanine ligase
MPVNMEQKKLTYRHTVRPSDKDTVREIVVSTGFFSEAEVEIAVELVTERLEKGLGSGYHFIFAEQEGRTVGYACFGPIPATRFSYDLYWIVVHNGWRGGGFGRAIMVESEAAIKKLGGRRVYAETSGRDQYQPTRAFYIACGYREEAILEDFYAPGDSKCFYVKVI